MRKGSKHTEETRRKLSKASKGKPSPMKGKPLSEEHKQKLSEAHKGNPAWNKGKPNSEESNEKNRIAHLGKKASEETCAKMSKSNKGRRLSDEHIKRISDALKGRTLSEEHRIKLSGKNANNWQGGITPENKKIRHSIELSLWREAVFARDNWTCQKYGIRGGILRAHHILNFSNNLDLRTTISNGITLSDRAHREFHKIYGQKFNTREQMEEFLGINTSLVKKKV
jgi:hypothetical protein